MVSGATGVLDAAVAFGARRYLDSVHVDVEWVHRESYDEFYDSMLFFEFLHHIVSYDKVVVDNSSATELGDELDPFFDRVNRSVGYDWIEHRDLASRAIGYPIGFVQTGICELIKEVLDSGIADLAGLLRIEIPWAYKRDQHVDFAAISRRATDRGLPESLIPFILFLWRGLVYGAFAHDHASQGEPWVYLTAPGRLEAMRAVLKESDVRRVEYPHKALQSVISDLSGVPSGGYDFSNLASLPPYARSPLSGEFARVDRGAALDLACDFRQTRDAAAMRRNWAFELLGDSSSCAVSPAYSQAISNVTVEGDLTQVQIIRALPVDL